jgi:hypothetical protein
MKLNKETLKRIIKEELQAVLNEDGNDAAVRRGVHGLAGSTLGDDAEKQRSAGFAKIQNSAQEAIKQANLDANDRQLAKDIADGITVMVEEGYTIEQAMKHINRDSKEDWKVEDAIKKGVQLANDKSSAVSAADAKFKKGTIIKRKIIPWARKNAGSIWKKSNASSEQEFKAYLGKMSSTDPEELAGAESALIDVLGQDLYDSILKGRGILDKFGGLFKRGSFTENKRRR